MAYYPPRNVFFLGVVSFFNDFASELVLSIFPAFFTSVLKAGAGSLGLVEGIADGAANLVKIYAGRLSDRTQKRKSLIVIGYALSTITRPLYLFTGSVAGVFGLRFADRIGKGLREGPRDAIISLSTPTRRLGHAFGFHRMLDTFGGVLGPLVAYLILRAYPGGFDIVFITAFVVGLCAVVSLFFVKDVVSAVKGENISLASFSIFPPDFRQYLMALFLLSVGSMPVALLLLKTQQLGLALSSIPLFYMIYSVSYASFSMWGGHASDHIGSRKVLRMGYLLLLLGYIVVFFAENIFILGIGFFVLGLFPALTDGVARALAAELSPAAHRGGAYGLVNATIGFGLMVAGIGGGYLWEHFSPSTALLTAGVFVALGLSALTFVDGKQVGAGS